MRCISATERLEQDPGEGEERPQEQQKRAASSNQSTKEEKAGEQGGPGPEQLGCLAHLEGAGRPARPEQPLPERKWPWRWPGQALPFCSRRPFLWELPDRHHLLASGPLVWWLCPLQRWEDDRLRPGAGCGGHRTYHPSTALRRTCRRTGGAAWRCCHSGGPCSS